ncbi:hypothetical protein M8J75_012192 [Diaphorina citri]|nr:hypothetical protein M8J75_012192 [Diaphorina citri]
MSVLVPLIFVYELDVSFQVKLLALVAVYGAYQWLTEKLNDWLCYSSERAGNEVDLTAVPPNPPNVDIIMLSMTMMQTINETHRTEFQLSSLLAQLQHEYNYLNTKYEEQRAKQRQELEDLEETKFRLEIKTRGMLRDLEDMKEIEFNGNNNLKTDTKTRLDVQLDYVQHMDHVQHMDGQNLDHVQHMDRRDMEEQDIDTFDNSVKQRLENSGDNIDGNIIIATQNNTGGEGDYERYEEMDDNEERTDYIEKYYEGDLDENDEYDNVSGQEMHYTSTLRKQLEFIRSLD